MKKHLFLILSALLLSLAAYAEQVAKPTGDAVSGTGISQAAVFKSAEVTCATEGATIRYELYEYGTTAPEVTENSPVFPADGRIFSDCTPGKEYQIRARAFKEGMEPSAIAVGWRFRIYLKANTVAEFLDLDPTSVDGVYNSEYPITFTGTATVTHFKKVDRYDNDLNYLYVQDETAAMCIHWYNGDLVAGDQITNLVLQRKAKSGTYGEYFVFSGSTKSSFAKAVLPEKTGHIDKLEPRIVDADKVKDQPANYLVKICQVQPTNISGNYFGIMYNGRLLANSVLRGWYFDSSIEKTLVNKTLYDITGLVNRNGVNPFLCFLSCEEHAPMPRMQPNSNNFSVYNAAANQPVYLICEDKETQIRYTTDGSEPNENSTLYTGPFTIPATPESCVRYKSFKDGLLPTEGVSLDFRRGENIVINFDFEYQRDFTPALGTYTDSDVLIEGPVTLTGKAGDVTVKMTLTPPEGEQLKLTLCKENTQALSIPEGTVIHIESSHAFYRLTYRFDYYTSLYGALATENSHITNDGEGCYDIFNTASPIYSIDFTAQQVRNLDPVFQSIMVTVNPGKPVAVTALSFENSTLDLRKGQSAQLHAIVTPDYAPASSLEWTSSDPEVATVDEHGNVTAVAGGEATVTATSKGNPEVKASVTVTVSTLATGLTFDRETASMNKGDILKIVAVVSPDDASDKSLQWSSSDPEVASVDGEGNVTAVKTGETVVTATHALGFSASCTVTVATPASGIALDKETVALTKGETILLNATISPDDADDKTVTWLSSDETIVSVDASGLVSARKSGSATISAADAYGHVAECAVSVTTPSTGVLLADDEITICKGSTATLSAAVANDDADDKTITWSGGDANIATVSAQGLVEAIASGSTTAVATDAYGNSAQCMITVVTPVTEITLDPIETVVAEGTSFTITAKVDPADADDKTVEWSSSDTDVAQVSAEGIVSALKPGTAIITAANDFHSSARAMCMVTVTENSGVSGLTSGGKVSFIDRTLTIVGFEGQTFTIYNSAGMAVRSFLVTDGFCERLSLPAALYLLRNQSGSVNMKILIP